MHCCTKINIKQKDCSLEILIDQQRLKQPKSRMSVRDFIKGLPSHDSSNFTHLSNEHGIRTSQKRASVYLPTEDEHSEQLIVMDKRCVLLRYLTQQWDKKTLQRKREHGGESGNGNGNSSTPNGNGTNSKKRPRLDPNELN